jgi:DNA-binding NarL/FixJ family response regulator
VNPPFTPVPVEGKVVVRQGAYGPNGLSGGETRMLRTLIVEDNAAFRESIKDILTAHVPTILLCEAGSCREARERMDEFLPMVVFMDIRLPDGSGLELTREFKRRNPETVVIVLTNYDLPEYRKAAFNSGASYFLVKDAVSPEEISALVQSVASQKGCGAHL